MVRRCLAVCVVMLLLLSAAASASSVGCSGISSSSSSSRSGGIGGVGCPVYSGSGIFAPNGPSSVMVTVSRVLFVQPLTVYSAVTAVSFNIYPSSSNSGVLYMAGGLYSLNTADIGKINATLTMVVQGGAVMVSEWTQFQYSNTTLPTPVVIPVASTIVPAGQYQTVFWYAWADNSTQRELNLLSFDSAPLSTWFGIIPSNMWFWNDNGLLPASLATSQFAGSGWNNPGALLAVVASGACPAPAMIITNVRGCAQSVGNGTSGCISGGVLTVYGTNFIYNPLSLQPPSANWKLRLYIGVSSVVIAPADIISSAVIQVAAPNVWPPEADQLLNAFLVLTSPSSNTQYSSNRLDSAVQYSTQQPPQVVNAYCFYGCAPGQPLQLYINFFDNTTAVNISVSPVTGSGQPNFTAACTNLTAEPVDPNYDYTTPCTCILPGLPSSFIYRAYQQQSISLSISNRYAVMRANNKQLWYLPGAQPNGASARTPVAVSTVGLLVSTLVLLAAFAA